MTVSEMIQALSSCPPGATVMVDPEPTVEATELTPGVVSLWFNEEFDVVGVVLGE